VAATREAATNAAKHAGTGHVDVYAEATAGRIEVFVRDRGAGFEPAAVPADRRGVRESILAGWRATAASPGALGARSGTEVELSCLDRSAR
jgi:nitrate/nitrite-specific signal transduction histidine kinase